MHQLTEKLYTLTPKRSGIIRSFLCLAPCLCLVSGCGTKALEGRLAQHQEESSAASRELLAALRSPGAMVLDWNAALKLLNERNSNLQQTRLRIERLRKSRDEQWKTWLPRIGAYSSLQTSLAALGSLSFSDLNASVVAPLTIPNPLTEQARALQHALSYLEAQDSFQLTYRRQVSALYRLFSQYEAVMSDRGNTQAATGRAAISTALGSLEAEAGREENVRSIQSGFAQILNLPGSQIIPVSSTRPKLNYERKYRSFVPGRNYAQLAMRLTAYQIEGALLREKGIKMAQWPTFSLSGSTPSVYDTRTESGIEYFDTDRIYLFGGLSKSYDLTGREADAVKSAEENTAFVKAALRLRLDQESREWIRLQTRYDQLLKRRALAQERFDSIRRRTTGGSASNELEALRAARQNLNALRMAQESLDLELWVWDESKWN